MWSKNERQINIKALNKWNNTKFDFLAWILISHNEHLRIWEWVVRMWHVPPQFGRSEGIKNLKHTIPRQEEYNRIFITFIYLSTRGQSFNSLQHVSKGHMKRNNTAQGRSLASPSLAPPCYTFSSILIKRPNRRGCRVPCATISPWLMGYITADSSHSDVYFAVLSVNHTCHMVQYWS